MKSLVATRWGISTQSAGPPTVVDGRTVDVNPSLHVVAISRRSWNFPHVLRDTRKMKRSSKPPKRITNSTPRRRRLLAGIAVLAGIPAAGAVTAVSSDNALAAGYCSNPVPWLYGPDSDTWYVYDVNGRSSVYVGGACRTHDYCYSGAPNLSRRNCDLNFLTNLRNTCEAKFDSTWRPSDMWDDCMGNANSFYNTVRALGSSHYHGPQNN